jgi:hypothetical protein
MNTTRYDLLSRPGSFVRIPELYATEAERIIEISRDEFILGEEQARRQHPFFNDTFILERARILSQIGIKHPQARKLRDEIYLKTCLRRNEMERKKVGITEYMRIKATLDHQLRRLSEE